MGSCHLILGSQLIQLGPLIWPVSDFGGTPRSGVKTQGGETRQPSPARAKGERQSSPGQRREKNPRGIP